MKIQEHNPQEFGRRNAEVGRIRPEFGRRDSVFGIKKVADGASEWTPITDDPDQKSTGEPPEFVPDPSTRNSHPEPRTPDPATRFPQGDARSVQTGIWRQKRFGSMRVIGQLLNTYIVCEAEAGLILIDQHAAHERILFEALSTRSADRKPSVQRLLVPETIELGFREAGLLEKLIPELDQLGLEIEPFGGNTFVVKSVPGLLAERDVKPLITEIVETAAQAGAGPGLAEALDRCRMVMACHGAIRANQALNEQQIKGLLDQLDECHNPSHCPHGRPTWLRWEIRELERSFKRIV